MSSDKPSRPFDADLQEHGKHLLADTEFDTDLGIELARDAQRVVSGELSEQAFYEKHHETVLDEFGEDTRVLSGDPAEWEDEKREDGPSGLVQALTDLTKKDELPRREAMEKGGFAAGALALGLFGNGNNAAEDGPDEGSSADAESVTSSDDEGNEGTQWGMVLNLNNCDASFRGCSPCFRRWPAGSVASRVHRFCRLHSVRPSVALLSSLQRSVVLTAGRNFSRWKFSVDWRSGSDSSGCYSCGYSSSRFSLVSSPLQ